MKRKEICILPQLNDKGGSMNPKKKWYIFYSYYNPASGKKEPFRDSTGFGKLKTKKERYAFAEKKITELTLKLQGGWNPHLGKTKVLYEDQLGRVDELRLTEKFAQHNTFSHYASLYLEEKAKLSRPETIITYRSKLRKFREWLVASNINEQVDNLTPEVIYQFFDYLINTKMLSRESIKNYKQLLTIIFDLAIDGEALADNPVDPSIKGGHRKDYGAQPISAEDLNKLMIALKDDPQLYLASLLEFYCFMRPGKEIRLMKVEWINWGSGTIAVPADLSKNKKPKHLTIPNGLMDELRRQEIHLAVGDHYVLGKGKCPGPECWGKNHFSMKFARLRDKLKLPKGYKFYSFKHTGNSVAEAAGIPLSSIMQQNGHSSLDITSRYLRKSAKVANRDILDNFPRAL